jgi:hypothetical protein
MLERGLRGMARTLRSMLSDEPEMRPQQFTLEERPRRRQRRQDHSGEERLEQDTTPEEGRPRRVVVAAPPPASTAASILRGELHDKSSLRRAILLSEIIDRPRAQRPHRSR